VRGRASIDDVNIYCLVTDEHQLMLLLNFNFWFKIWKLKTKFLQSFDSELKY